MLHFMVTNYKEQQASSVWKKLDLGNDWRKEGVEKEGGISLGWMGEDCL